MANFVAKIPATTQKVPRILGLTLPAMPSGTIQIVGQMVANRVKLPFLCRNGVPRTVFATDRVPVILVPTLRYFLILADADG